MEASNHITSMRCHVIRPHYIKTNEPLEVKLLPNQVMVDNIVVL